MVPAADTVEGEEVPTGVYQEDLVGEVADQRETAVVPREESRSVAGAAEVCHRCWVEEVVGQMEMMVGVVVAVEIDDFVADEVVEGAVVVGVVAALVAVDGSFVGVVGGAERKMAGEDEVGKMAVEVYS